MVFNLCEKRDIFHMIRASDRYKLDGGLNTAHVMPCFAQLVHAVCAIHRRGVAHLDIKPEVRLRFMSVIPVALPIS